MRRSDAAIGVLHVSRCAVEGVIFACATAGLHLLTAGRDPLPLGSMALLTFGVALILSAILREARTETQSARLVVVAIGVAIVAGFLLPARQPDGLAILSRLIGFGTLGLVFLWRALSLARSVVRWSAVRDTGVLAALSLGIAALLPASGFDHGALPVFALLVVVATGVGLSLARSTEELALSADEARGGAGGASATGMAFVLGSVAVVVAALMPSLQVALAGVAAAAGDVLAAIVYVIALPFGYLVAWLVPLLRPLAQWLPLHVPEAISPAELEQQERMREAMEQTRPLVAGALELLVAGVAVLFAILLIDRLTRERRVTLSDGATLERGAAGGYGLRAAISGLLPRRRASRRAPRDDGTAAGAVRVLYWRLLTAAERAGLGWRESSETPSEHAARLVGADPRWTAAAPIVRAFERVRYGEEDIAPAAAEEARHALHEVRAAIGARR